jgi:hypothetical protein
MDLPGVRGAEVVAGVAVARALVELLANFVGKTGDFAGAKMHDFQRILEFLVWLSCFGRCLR